MLWGSDPRAPALPRALLVLHRLQARARSTPECDGSTGSGRRKGGEQGGCQLTQPH